MNPQWAYSAMSVDDAVVISCWQHKLKYARGVLTYQDHLSRWQLNPPGKNLLAQHLSVAVERSLDVRLVIASTDQPDVVDRDEDASRIKKTFHIKENAVAKVIYFDGDNFTIEFRASH